jgi:hypothetical protein
MVKALLPYLKGTVGSRVEERLALAHGDAVGRTGGGVAGEYPKTGAEVLVVGRDGIWEMDQYGCVMRHEGAHAIGAGQRYALGALWMAEKFIGPALRTMDEDLKRAVEAACHYLPSCGGVVQVEMGGEVE